MAPDSREWQSPSGWRDGSSAWFARRDRRSCSWAHSFGSLPQRRRGVSLGKFSAQLAQETEFGLEIDIMRQLQVLDEAGRLHIVRMRHHEFLVLRRSKDLFAK